MKVTCYTKDKRVQNFGSCKGNLKDLKTGETYTVVAKKVYGFHTKIWLKGIDGDFNDCLFDENNKDDKEKE